MHFINRLDGLRYLIKRQSEQAAMVTLLRRRPSQAEDANTTGGSITGDQKFIMIRWLAS